MSVDCENPFQLAVFGFLFFWGMAGLLAGAAIFDAIVLFERPRVRRMFSFVGAIGFWVPVIGIPWLFGLNFSCFLVSIFPFGFVLSMVVGILFGVLIAAFKLIQNAIQKRR